MDTITKLTDSRGIAFEPGDEVVCVSLYGTLYRIRVTSIRDGHINAKSEHGTRARLVHDGHQHILEGEGARDYMPGVYVLSSRIAEADGSKS